MTSFSQLAHIAACRDKRLAEKALIGQGTSLLPEDILKKVFELLSFQDLKSVRLTNHYWFQTCRSLWENSSQIVLRDWKNVRTLAADFASTRKDIIPLTIINWTFQGVTIQKLMNARGYMQNETFKAFWPTIENLTLSEWNIKTWAWEYVFPDPRYPYRRVKRKRFYESTHKIGSSYHISAVCRLTTNLAKLVIHFPLLINIRGTVIGPRQFPKMDKLKFLHIYYDGDKLCEFGVSVKENTNPIEDYVAALMKDSKKDTAIPNISSGGSALMIRILDHCPNLSSVSATSGSILTVKMEEWMIARILLSEPTRLSPTISSLVMSIPLQDSICQGLKLKAADTLKLKSLHLRVLPGEHYLISNDVLHEMISAFSGTLEHLEIMFLNKPDIRSETFPNCKDLEKLKSIEIWGFMGVYSFLSELPQLESAIIGEVRDGESYLKTEEYFKSNPLPAVKIELKSFEEFQKRLLQGAISPPLKAGTT